VTVGFRPGYPEVNANNVMFSGVKSGGRFRMGDASAEIPEAIAPKEGEVVVVKHRVSGFAGTDLEMVLKAARVETLVMFGIATSGVVLSTVRAGADLDYRIVVISDLCLDIDKQANEFLLTNILPRQATVTDSETFLK
jgi:nicotinamidase-related amidase